MNVSPMGNNNRLNAPSFGAKYFLVAEGNPAIGNAGWILEAAVAESHLAANEIEKNCRLLGIPVACERERFLVDGTKIKSTRGFSLDIRENDPQTLPKNIATHVIWTGRDARRVHKKYPEGVPEGYLYKYTPVDATKLDTDTVLKAIKLNIFGFKRGGARIKRDFNEIKLPKVR